MLIQRWVLPLVPSLESWSVAEQKSALLLHHPRSFRTPYHGRCSRERAGSGQYRTDTAGNNRWFRACATFSRKLEHPNSWL